LLRFCFFICSLCFVWGLSFAASAASTPVTPPGTGIPNTCDSDFWNVVRYKAQMAGQREITQNSNLTARPDSVLELSCFEDHMRHLARYADQNFPGDPFYSDGRTFGLPVPPRGFFTDTLIVAIRNAVGSSDPWLAGRGGLKGGELHHILEILVLDSLVRTITSIGAVIDATNLSACSKGYYITANDFDGTLIGGRSLTYNSGTNSFNPQTQGSWNSQILFGNYNCQQMNRIWEQVRCDNFQHDDTISAGNEFSAMHRGDLFHPINIVTESTANASYQTFRGEYLDEEIADRDFRVFKQMCRRDTRFLGTIATDLFCSQTNHGTGPGSTASMLMSSAGWSSPPPDLTAPDPNPPWNIRSSLPTIWQQLYARTYRVPGSAGALDPYDNYLALLDNANCNAITPVRTGLIVQLDSGVQYHDAVCPAPGCWYDPPSSLAATGTCEP